jgi:uncharacterized protein YjbI with pentapeptide repeats
MKMKRLTQEELDVILGKHKKWLNNETDGECADLGHADLRNANLQDADLWGADLGHADLWGADLGHADLRNADLWNADLRNANLQNADLRNANLQNADLQDADLQDADLRNADLRNANLDFSCLPLWCGSLSAHFDDKLLKQIAYHIVKAGLQSKNASGEAKAELSRLIDFANGFHRVNECGAIEKENEHEN